ncbi:MAG: ATP-binding cassette domain-containing protein, partial [Bdellovibrionales bacterium]|nr:ATP-binding cassette domain-containing protein [Bdellovibrionales bacterium]
MAPLIGDTQYGYEVFSAYFAQHVSEGLNQNHTVLEAMGMKAHPSVVHQTVLNMAGSLLFSGEDVKKKISVLSGGEKSRVALGQILLERAPFLILDEPTNHLDFQTVEAFTQALIAYEGTLIVVSHDRSFVQRVATKILEIRDGMAESFPGSYDDYVWSCQKGVLSERGGTPAAMPSAKAVSSTGKFSTNVDSNRKFERPKSGEVTNNVDSEKLNYKDQKKQLERDLRKAEKDLKDAESQMAKFQTEVQALNQKLIDHPGDASTWQWIQEISAAAQETSRLEESWLSLSEKLESLNSELKELKGEA